MGLQIDQSFHQLQAVDQGYRHQSKFGPTIEAFDKVAIDPLSNSISSEFDVIMTNQNVCGPFNRVDRQIYGFCEINILIQPSYEGRRIACSNSN